MSIRSEIESRILSWAATQNPAIPVSVEGVHFEKPTNGSPFLEIFFLKSRTTNPTLDAIRVRQKGFAQVSCWAMDGKGSGEVEALAQNIVNLFPVVPKSLFETISIEQTPNSGQAITEANWRIIPVTISYRQES